MNTSVKSGGVWCGGVNATVDRQKQTTIITKKKVLTSKSRGQNRRFIIAKSRKQELIITKSNSQNR